MRVIKKSTGLVLLTWFVVALPAAGGGQAPAPVSLEEIIEKQRELEREQERLQQTIAVLRRQVRPQRQGSGSPLAKFNPRISLNGLFAAAGFSDDESLNFGDHDPKENGFNVQNVELFVQASVDPYFTAQSNIVFFFENGATKVELEETFMTTTVLPFNLQAMGGRFFTRFGRMNWQHPHRWDFANQSVIHNGLFGTDGLRGPGLQASWLIPVPLYLELIGSAPTPRGEIGVSFLGEHEAAKEKSAIGG